MSLEQIKDKLSQCFKNHQPVLLYGDSLDKRNNIILDTHTKNGGKLYDVKYIGDKEEHVFLQDIAKEREKKEREWLRNDNISLSRFERFKLDGIQKEIHNKVRKNFKSTKKSYKYLDCKGKNGESVYQLLANDCLWCKIEIPYSEYGLIPLEKTSSKEFLETYRNPVPILGNYLYGFRGTLFVDNLKCDNKNNEDVVYFYKLVAVIINLIDAIKLIDVFKENSFNWLVVYVHNRDNFPVPFLNQFEQIYLEDKETVVEPARTTIESEVENSLPKEEPKDKYVFRENDGDAS